MAAGEPVGTLFLAADRLASRKHWIAFTTRTRGELVVDDGAARALVERGKSLLPAGITAIARRVRDRRPGGVRRCARASRSRADWSPTPPRRSSGSRACRRTRIDAVLGYSNGDEVIHRDDLVALGGQPARRITSAA